MPVFLLLAYRLGGVSAPCLEVRHPRGTMLSRPSMLLNKLIPDLSSTSLKFSLTRTLRFESLLDRGKDRYLELEESRDVVVFLLKPESFETEDSLLDTLVRVPEDSLLLISFTDASRLEFLFPLEFL